MTFRRICRDWRSGHQGAEHGFPLGLPATSPTSATTRPIPSGPTGPGVIGLAGAAHLLASQLSPPRDHSIAILRVSKSLISDRERGSLPYPFSEAVSLGRSAGLHPIERHSTVSPRTWEYSYIHAVDCSAPRRTTRHRPYPRHAGRQDRTQPPPQPDPRGHGPRPVQGLVRRLRPRPRQDGRPRPPTFPPTSGNSSPTASTTRASRRGGVSDRSMKSLTFLMDLPCRSFRQPILKTVSR